MVLRVLLMPEISEKNSFSPSGGGLGCSEGGAIAPSPPLVPPLKDNDSSWHTNVRVIRFIIAPTI